MNQLNKTFSWIAQILAAVILGQTLFFKLTGAEEAIALFEKLGAEPWGRYGTGIVEGLAAILLLRAKTASVGAALGAGLMVGAVGSHLGPLGIDWQGDGGFLFGLALTTLIACTFILFVRRAELPILGKIFARA